MMNSRSNNVRRVGAEFQSQKTATISWKIRLCNEDLASLRQIAEEIGKIGLFPKPTVTALLHKAIQSYIAAWEERRRPEFAWDGPEPPDRRKHDQINLMEERCYE